MEEVDGHISETETTMNSVDQTHEQTGEEGEDGVPFTDGPTVIDSDDSCGENESGDKYRIDGEDDIRKVDLIMLSEEEFKMYHFSSRLVAFQFYNKYGEKRGFAARRWNTVVNKEGIVSQQTFVCFREGYRLKKHLKKENRKREARAITRCGCFAYLKVRFAREVCCWIVKAFCDEHSHELLPRKYEGMLSSHLKMSETDIIQMNTMREVGIGVTQIYGLAANQSGGYENVGYKKSDMYNEIFKQRRSDGSDARGALSYLRAMGRNDKDLFWSHTVDEEGRLKHLFWSDGRSQGDYKVFGDVLAFDATYRRNKYMSPLVVFAGVNHHNQTIVFGSALVANETEETYVWLLKEFLRGKKKVELYEKKKMWATAHIRGSFFAGFRTTSRCEGLHSQVGRQKELEADYESINGDPVLQTPFEDIEAAGAKLYTRKVFMKFRVMLWRACKLEVSGCARTPNCHIYIVSNRSTSVREWHVSYVSQNEEVKCSCQRTESLGIPCEHIVVLLHYLDIKQLPKSLIFDRWTKYAKQCVDGADMATTTNVGSMWKSEVMSLLFDCCEMCRLAGKRIDKLEETRGVIRNHMQSLKENSAEENGDEDNDGEG
ncbi:Zinc finger, PMZ-type [Sesbania bispinosa]|nr:Zinc finger, PMZ-type [Sesbania bispinosa]